MIKKLLLLLNLHNDIVSGAVSRLAYCLKLVLGLSTRVRRNDILDDVASLVVHAAMQDRTYPADG